MKIRKGFVSNSSSSSFLIALKELPSSSKEVHEMLWGGIKETTEDKIEHDCWCEIIYGGILSSRQLSTWQIPEIFHENGVYDDTIDYTRDDYHIKIVQNTNKAIDAFLGDNDGPLFVLLHYEDCTEIGSELEHHVPWEQASNVFRFSHH